MSVNTRGRGVVGGGGEGKNALKNWVGLREVSLEWHQYKAVLF